ncbi:condensin-2 complex subunit G2 [Caerostris extrusa]|uniref:Condensin-2 complex subunit G2 n=1 Tax=Caerostris extrusa TaxID=172846 RepID=A0AAV4QU10_CAEEX|nr:condensin-2 complex subunit G2 [Caerostris extrusa]
MPSCLKYERKRSIKSKEDEKKEKDVSKQHFLGLSLLSALINHRSCQKIVLTKHADLLQEFLNLADNAKRKIELSTETLSEDEADFITELMYILLQIYVLLEAEEKNNSAKFVEDTTVWIQNKLIKRAYLDMSRNASTTQSMLLRKKQSAAFQKLTVKMCKDVCRIISDITLLGYFNVKSLKFLKFGLQLLGLESGSEFLLPISKMLLNHVSYGIYLTLEEKDDSIIKFVPDSFSKIFQFLKDQNFVINIPTALKELVSSVILMATKAIINNILVDIQNLDHIEQFHHPFNTIIISKSGAFLLSIMCLKPKIMVLFLQQIQKYLINSERNMQSWAAICVIVNHISVMKSMSKIISKEICSVMEKLEDILEGKEPLKNIDTNLPSLRLNLSLQGD